MRREEIDALLPADVTSPRALDDLVSRCRDAGIEVVESASRESVRARLTRTDEDVNETDHTPRPPETSSEVVRLYLKEIGRGPRLTREEEMALAKRFERGTRAVMRALSQTPSVVQQVIRLGDELKRNGRLLRGLVTPRQGDVPGEPRRLRDVLVQIDAISAAWADAETGRASCTRMTTRNRRTARRARWEAGRARARVAQLVRRMAFSEATRCRFASAHPRRRSRPQSERCRSSSAGSARRPREHG